MRRPLPFSLRSVVIGAVTALHAALYVVMALPMTRAPVPDGGAPVINLTLVPAPSFDDDVPGAETAASSAPPTPAPARQPLPPRHVVRTIPPEIAHVAAPSPVQAAPPIGATAPDAAPSPSTALPGTSNAAPSIAGLTSGGGARSLGGSARPEQDLYAARVIAWVEAHKGRAPHRMTGVVTVRFVLDRMGRVRESTVTASSGDRSLDALGLAAIRAASPFPRPPSGVTWRTREFNVRLDYRRRQ